MSRQDDRLLVDDSAFSNDYMNSLSKVRRDIIEDCMVALGYPVITLFITQRQVDRLINFSVRRCESKACQTFLELFYVSSGCIDVSQYNMEAVRQIYPADIDVTGGKGNDLTVSDGDGCSCNSFLSGCDICEKLCHYRMYSFGLVNSDGRNRIYDLLSYQYAKSELNKLSLQDWYLDSVEGKLYIDDFSGWVTVEYVKAGCTIEDLEKNVYWKNWVRDYTLAMVKITEGRIRSKYKISSGVFEIESDELINEGNNDKQELEQKLDEDMGYWNIMR